MLKTFKYRIYPTKKQLHTMNQWLEECRWLYNHFLSERKEASTHPRLKSEAC